jgi:hypothetical protein
MRHRFDFRQFAEAFCGNGRVILPPRVTEYDVARRKPRRLGGYDFGNAAAGHYGVRLDRSAIGCAVHPGPVGSVE